MNFKKLTGNFTQVANSLINDDRLSLKAKGLFLYLNSKPDDWTFSIDRIARQQKDSAESVATGINELIKFGYLSREQKNNEGVFGPMIYELSYSNSTASQFSGDGNTGDGFCGNGKPPHTSNKDSNKKESTKKDFNGFVPPLLDYVKEYFKENGYTEESAIKAFNYYTTGNWKDSRGNKVKNWKQKMQSVWFKDENKIQSVKKVYHHF